MMKRKKRIQLKNLRKSLKQKHGGGSACGGNVDGWDNDH